MAGGQVRCGACLHVFDAQLHGWSTDAVMHATEAPALASLPLLPTHASHPTDEAEAFTHEDPPIAEFDDLAEPITKTDPVRPEQYTAIRRYGRWWLLGAALGAIILLLGWWFTG